MDGFDAWAAKQGLPATEQIDGDEVVIDRTKPLGANRRRKAQLAFCDAGHPGHNPLTECGPCRDERLAGLR